VNLAAFLEQLKADGRLDELATNPAAQFGVRPVNLMGAQFLPERLQPLNMYKETQIRYRTFMANSASRYSPVQLKQGGQLVGSMSVELGESDVGVEITAQDYDYMLELLNNGSSQDAAARLLGLLDVQVNQALAILNEKQRWDAILDASVIRTGDNGYSETVTYPNPAGHRINAGGTWSIDSYDPFADLLAIREAAEDKGQVITRIVTSSATQAIFMRNEKVVRRSGSVTVITPSETYTDTADLARVQAKVQELGLPPIEVYNQRYYDQEGTAGRFLPVGNMVFFCSTGRTEVIEPQAGDPLYLEDTLGYMGIGRAAGQSGPGRVLRVEAFDNKPPRIEAEGWQTALPVIMDPEAVFVLKNIS
jgi:ribosomal protein L36